MMRTPSKVMMVSSSPGRAEKLPAPMLARLLRGKGGSRSRGRSSSLSRSSPMFVARRRSASAASVDMPDEKEPSSPKVTCIGQVRISKRKSTSSSSRPKQQQKQGRCTPQGCRCLKRGFFCNPFSKRLSVKFTATSASPPPYRHHHPLRGWRRWFLLPRPGCYRRRKVQQPQPQPQQHQLWREDGPRTGAGATAGKARSDDDGERSEEGNAEEEEDEEGETKVFVPTTPPKNALLLMRCRSAPHRATCLPDRLWAPSPYTAEGDGAASTAATAPRDMEGPSHGEKRGDEPAESYESRSGFNESLEECREGEEEEDEQAAAVGPSPSFSSRPLILTRCKSEPARRAAKLAAPEASHCFWNSGSSGNSNQMNTTKSGNNQKRWSTLLGEACAVYSQ